MRYVEDLLADVFDNLDRSEWPAVADDIRSELEVYDPTVEATHDQDQT